MDNAQTSRLFPAGGGEMGERIRRHDWSATTLGPREHWSRRFGAALELLLDAHQPAYIAWGPELTSLYNDSYIPILGSKHPTALGTPYAHVWPEIWHEHRPVVEQILAGQVPEILSQPIVLAARPGDMRSWFTLAWNPLRSEDGMVNGFYCVATETTAHALIEPQLRTSEARYRTLFESMSEGFCIIEKVHSAPGEPIDFRYIAANPAFEAETGVGAVVGKTIRSAFPGEPQEWFDTYDHVLTSGQPIRFERELVTQGRYLELYAFRIDDQTGRRVGVIFQDITERKHAEVTMRGTGERLRLVVGELQHRTRNLLAVVRSVADRTIRTSVDLADFRYKFRDRLDALARVQSLLSRLDNDHVTFSELLRAELSAHGVVNGMSTQITLEGPTDIALRSTSVQPLAMAIHELATNAIKYGALRQVQAHLTVRWSRQVMNGQACLYIDWRETGVVMPRAGAMISGAGRELIEHAIPHQLRAETRYVLSADGVHCTMALPELP